MVTNFIDTLSIMCKVNNFLCKTISKGVQKPIKGCKMGFNKRSPREEASFDKYGVINIINTFFTGY